MYITQHRYSIERMPDAYGGEGGDLVECGHVQLNRVCVLTCEYFISHSTKDVATDRVHTSMTIVTNFNMMLFYYNKSLIGFIIKSQ